MVRVSIISLIYQSAGMADRVWESVRDHTPMLTTGEAEFFFVANDPTPGLVAHLEDRGYPFILNTNKHYSDEELFAMGFGTPEHMGRVYRGYNEGVRAARGDYVLLVNSDNLFSDDWVENLLKYSDRNAVITSKLVERNHPAFGVFPGAIEADFGDTMATFDEDAFAAFVTRTKKTGLETGGAYMPALFHRDILIEAGLYPNGNIAGATFDEVVRFGDEALYDTLASLGVHHYTALDSIVYHLKEGEREDLAAVASADSRPTRQTTQETVATRYEGVPSLKGVYYGIEPTKRHRDLMRQLLGGPAYRPPLTRRLGLSPALLGRAKKMLPKRVVEWLRRVNRG